MTTTTKIPPRSKCPRPDPLESNMLSGHPVFAKGTTLWLPDSTPAEYVEESPLSPCDELQCEQFEPCPPKGPPKQSDALIRLCSHARAQWVFETYIALVKHRLKVYNTYRKQYNQNQINGL